MNDPVLSSYVEETTLQRALTFEHIFRKYENCADEDSDVIDLENMTIVEDAGRLKELNVKKCFGSFSNYTVSSTVQKYVKKLEQTKRRKRHSSPPRTRSKSRKMSASKTLWWNDGDDEQKCDLYSTGDHLNRTSDSARVFRSMIQSFEACADSIFSNLYDPIIRKSPRTQRNPSLEMNVGPSSCSLRSSFLVSSNKRMDVTLQISLEDVERSQKDTSLGFAIGRPNEIGTQLMSTKKRSLPITYKEKASGALSSYKDPELLQSDSDSHTLNRLKPIFNETAQISANMMTAIKQAIVPIKPLKTKKTSLTSSIIRRDTLLQEDNHALVPPCPLFLKPKTNGTYIAKGLKQLVVPITRLIITETMSRQEVPVCDLALEVKEDIGLVTQKQQSKIQKSEPEDIILGAIQSSPETSEPLSQKKTGFLTLSCLQSNPDTNNAQIIHSAKGVPMKDLQAVKTNRKESESVQNCPLMTLTPLCQKSLNVLRKESTSRQKYSPVASLPLDLMTLAASTTGEQELLPVQTAKYETSNSDSEKYRKKEIQKSMKVWKKGEIDMVACAVNGKRSPSESKITCLSKEEDQSKTPLCPILQIMSPQKSIVKTPIKRNHSLSKSVRNAPICTLLLQYPAKF